MSENQASVRATDTTSEAESPRRDLTGLRRILVRCFDEEELRTLCVDVGVSYDVLPARGQEGKARELIHYLDRRGRISELIDIGKRLRPNEPWGEVALEADWESAIARYNQHVVHRYGRLTLYSLKADTPLNVELERVYVQLTAVERVRRLRGQAEPAEQDAVVERVLSAREALAEAPRMVIIGAPGSGKTTLLQWVALTFARGLAQERLGLETHYVPVLIPLRAFGKYVENHPDRFEFTPACLLDFLVSYLDGWRLDLPEGLFAQLAQEGRLVLLLDGLDEVADPGRRADVARALEAFIARYDENRYIVTSRLAGYTGLARFGIDFQRRDIHPFSDEDVEAFVTNWYLAVETALEDNLVIRQKAEEKAEDLLRRIHESDRIRRLVDTPLLLTVVALVHENRTSLPHRRAELYDECIQMLLGFWDEQKGGEAGRELAQVGGLDRQDKRAILEPVALRCHERRETRDVDGRELRRWFREELAALGYTQPRQKARRLLQVIQERAGLLVESEPDTFRFSHLTFQEYLAARAVADREDYIEYTLARRYDPWWWEVILLEVGHLSIPRNRRARRLTTDLIRAIWQADEENPLEQEVEGILRRNLLLAGFCLVDLGPIGVEDTVREGIIVELGQVLRASPYSRLQKETAEVLAELGRAGAQQAVDELICTLADAGNSEAIRQKAAASLGRLGRAPPPVIQALVAALIPDTSPYVRWTVVNSLGQLGQTTPEVVQALITALADADPYVQGKAARSLVQLGRVTPDIVQAVMTVLADGAPYVRRVAAVSLGQIGQATPDVIQALISALSHDDDPYVRGQAAASLGRFDQVSPDVIQALVAALASDNEDVRWTAVSSLVQLGRTELVVVQVIVGILADAAVPYYVRRAAAVSLGQLDQSTPDVIQSLVVALADDNEVVRQAAVVSLGQLGQLDSAVIQLLINTLADDGSAQVCQAAAVSLGQLGQATPDVVRALIVALAQASSGQVRQAAAASLGQLGQATPDVIQAFIAALGDDTASKVRRAVAINLGQCEQATPDIVQSLIAALADVNLEVCQAAAGSLVQLGQAAPDDISRALVVAIADDANDARVRQAAAAGLGQLGQVTPDIIQALVSNLADDDAELRQSAAASLGQLGQGAPDVVQSLVATLADVNEDVREAAAVSLGQLGQARADVIQALIAALADVNEEVRWMAATSLGQLGQATLDVLQALVGALADAEWPVRRAAVSSLAQLMQPSPDVIQALIVALSDAEWSVRQAAATGLGRLGQVSSDVIQVLVVALSDVDLDVCDMAAANLIRLAAVDRDKVLRVLMPAFSGPVFETTRTLGRPTYEYAFDVLWAIARGASIEN